MLNSMTFRRPAVGGILAHAKGLVQHRGIYLLKAGAAGAKTEDLCRNYGVSTGTFYAWRQKFAGMTLRNGAAC